MTLITSSRLRTFRRCRREHHLRYGLGYTTQSSSAQDFGTLVHKGLEAWWLWSDTLDTGDDRIAWAITTMRQAVTAARYEGVDIDPYDLARAEAMLIGYDSVHGGDRYEVLGVEMEWRAELPALRFEAPVKLGGKFDALVRDSNGRILIVEHKTSSEDISPGSAYWARLRLDGQVSLYYLGAQALGYDVAGVLYDVLGKPGMKPLKASAEVRYTKGKTKKCGQCVDGVPFCGICGGTGRIEVEAPRPMAGQRLADETPDEYRGRIVESLAADPDRYYQRTTIVRLEGEQARHLEELRAEVRELASAAPLPNPDACTRYGSVCPFFAACSGERRIDEYPRLDWPHPELTEDK